MAEQLRLVVAEDNDTDAALIARHLAKGGVKCTMHRVRTEFDFIDALHDIKPDVIISGFSMPQFDGRRALEIAGVRAPDTPFLFVSGSDDRNLPGLDMEVDAKGRFRFCSPAVTKIRSVVTSAIA